jgi:NlpC/P60 family putative phage cell wall peptidase
MPAYTPDWSEANGEEILWRAALRHLEPVGRNAAGPGQVLLFRMRGGAVAKHLGVSAHRDGATTFIHAYAGHGVTESTLTTPWARRVVARFAFPERI